MISESMLSYISGKQSSLVLLTYFCVLLFCLHSKCLLACGEVKGDTPENRTLLAEEHFPHFLGPTKCIWKIRVPTDYRIELTVHVFEIKTSCCTCVDDYVEFRDGLSTKSPLIGRYCANIKPKTVYSSQNVLTVKYFSSSRNRPVNLTTVNKFKASYRKICGKFIRESSAVIRSPSLYQNFASVNRCLFTIVVPHGWVKVTFSNFTVGKSVTCHTDFVMIKETAFVEVEGTALKHERLCGKLKSFYIFSKGPELSFLYQSSKVVESRFAATFKSTNTSRAPCGGLLTNDAGYIYSYGYPKQYPEAAKCVWKIEVQHGFYIELKFLEFDFAPMTTGCANGQVEVYDGWSSNSVKIATACYGPLRKTWISKSNRLLIKATSKNKEAGKFVLNYKLVKQGLCSANKFLCTSRQCLRKSVVCDGINDCSDGSDELNCPERKHRKSLYVIWILLVFFASIVMVIWLWRTWRKAVHRTVQIQRNQCPEAEDYACEVPSQSGAPPSYSEALNHTPTSLPTYEEALLDENGEVILEQGNTVRYHARSDSCSRHLLPLRHDPQRRHGNTRRSALGIV